MVAGSSFPFSEVFPGFFFFPQDPAVRVTNRCFYALLTAFPKWCRRHRLFKEALFGGPLVQQRRPSRAE